jgi:hypothetical protein
MYSQRLLQAYNALLNECANEVMNIQDSNIKIARIMAEITESDLKS